MAKTPAGEVHFTAPAQYITRMKLLPLGDQAVLAYFSDEAAAIRFAEGLRAAGPEWLLDVVPAYASVGVFFDPERVSLRHVIGWLLSTPLPTTPDTASLSRRHVVPVCYEFNHDLARVSVFTGLSEDGVIRLHSGAEYTVYAIGFAPGFPYLGYLPEQLCGVERLPSPRLRVEPGSVGLTGRQTGIYPLPRPGGWNLIGRTPLTLVDVASAYFPIRVGDRVRFERIDTAEFRRLAGERL